MKLPLYILLICTSAIFAGGCSDSVTNDDTACANCSSFIHYKLEDYADEHDGYYPRGGKTPLDSLAKCIHSRQDAHLFTSHLRAGKCMDYWEKNKSLNEYVTVYRYNEGLCEADSSGLFMDPDSLILMYYYKESNTHKGKGRFVSGVPASKFYFMTEAQFQSNQKRTETFLKKRNERAEEKKEVREKLKLVIDCKSPEPGIYDFSFSIVNKDKETANVELVDEGEIISCSGIVGQNKGNFGTVGSRYMIEKGERKTMTGFATAKLSIQTSKADVIYTNFNFKTKNASGGGGPGEGSPDKDEFWIRIHLPIKVSIGNIKELELLLTSNKYKYVVGKKIHTLSNGSRIAEDQ